MSALIALGAICVCNTSKWTGGLYCFSLVLTKKSLNKLPHVNPRLYVFLRNLLQESLLRIVSRIYYNKTLQYIPPDPYTHYVRTPRTIRGKIET